VRPWADINNTGRGLILLSVVNIVCSIIFIRDGMLAESLMSFCVGMLCGLSTFQRRYDR
jgi:hypothetical protein